MAHKEQGQCGVTGIGRLITVKYSNETGFVISYTLDEGDIEFGQLHGFGRTVLCYGQTHKITTGFFDNGELFESRPFN